MNATGVALVTGSARGIGRAIALDLAMQGFDTVIHYRDSHDEAESTADTARQNGVRSMVVQADLVDQSQAARLVDETVAAFGGISVLVNVVGNYHLEALDTVPFDQWHDMFDSNLHATFYVCRAALVHLRQSGRGRIVNFGFAGTDNLVAQPLTTAYAIAKAGVTLLTKAIAVQEATTGVTANIVAPGVIETSRSQPIGQIPMGRVGTVDEVVRAVRFFTSTDASYITGQTIEVAGGWNL
jgi:3-oxoacyl-[acyl-carrier protein] reductase